MGRISQLTEITTIDNADLLYGVDVDDLTHSPDGSPRKFTKQNLLKEINSRAGDIESDVSDLESAVANILNLVYPVGSIYTNATDDTNPGTLLGVGTWEAFGQGRVMVGKNTSGTFATAGATGGAETHTHRQGGPSSDGSGSGGGSISGPWNDGTFGRSSSGVTFANYSQIVSSGIGSSKTVYPFLTESSSSLQPYIVVYVWKRTA